MDKIDRILQAIDNREFPDCQDVLKKYFTEEEIKEAKKKLVACGCSVCCMNYLMGKFPNRIPKGKGFCFGT